MKIKKLFAAFIAAATVMGTAALTSFAEESSNSREATYCFDTASNVSDWQTYGSVSETGFKFSQTTKESKSGNGCLIVSEDVSGEVEDAFGGAFVTADTFGLADFRGCTISMSVMLSDNADNHHENLFLYSDGMIWIQTAPETLSSTEWSDVTLMIPEDAANTKVGFTIPTFDVYSGDVMYIDDFAIIDSNGNPIANVGDYQAKSKSIINAVPGWVNIVLIVVLVILVVAIIAGIGMLISSNVGKFH